MYLILQAMFSVWKYFRLASSLFTHCLSPIISLFITMFLFLLQCSYSSCIMYINSFLYSCVCIYFTVLFDCISLFSYSCIPCNPFPIILILRFVFSHFFLYLTLISLAYLVLLISSRQMVYCTARSFSCTIL